MQPLLGLDVALEKLPSVKVRDRYVMKFFQIRKCQMYLEILISGKLVSAIALVMVSMTLLGTTTVTPNPSLKIF